MAKRTQPRKAIATAEAEGPLIAIRACDDDKEPIEEFVLAGSEQAIRRMALQWGYILRVRRRWADDLDMRENFGAKAVTDLVELGIKLDTIRKFASASHIEVELYDHGSNSADADSALDAASEIPWEYLLSAATQKLGRFESLLITRCLSNHYAITPTRPESVLFVESAPGRIAEIYDFIDEEARLGAAVNLKENSGLTFSKTEPFSKLKGTLRTKAWQAVHVTGIDTHQAAWLIDDFYSAVARRTDVIDKSDRLHDGMILRGDSDSELPVRYDELADLLIESKPPGVITLNLYFSGARTARELVKRGAYAALGFLDQIDDEFAELFFQAFYWAWCHDDKLIPDAFLDAWSKMVDRDRLHGTSIVIWLGRSMVGQLDSPAKKPARVKSAQSGGR
jgi:hypothetical protein